MATASEHSRTASDRPSQAAGSPSFIDPNSLMKIKNLQMRAKVIVEGFFSGLHRSPYHGFSVEYLDHRAYTPGDDPRTLDWKILARSDKYQVKLFEDETNLRAYILLDCSESMAFRYLRVKLQLKPRLGISRSTLRWMNSPLCR